MPAALRSLLRPCWRHLHSEDVGTRSLDRACVSLAFVASERHSSASQTLAHQATMTRRHCLALDLKDDPVLIQEYKRQHERIWPEIRHHLTTAGVVDMQIYALGTRLFMVMDVAREFTFEAMDALAAANPKVQEWEDLMWRFQAPTPWTPPGHKWVEMERIFDLTSQH